MFCFASSVRPSWSNSSNHRSSEMNGQSLPNTVWPFSRFAISRTTSGGRYFGAHPELLGRLPQRIEGPVAAVELLHGGVELQALQPQVRAPAHLVDRALAVRVHRPEAHQPPRETLPQPGQPVVAHEPPPGHRFV